MKKTIVTTTINPPTEAIRRFIAIAEEDGWSFVIVGDRKTPHAKYRELEEQHLCVMYLDCEDQERMYKDLSDAIGWNCIQRRNIGYVYAWKKGAQVIATIDDDNIPYAGWGRDVKLGKEGKYRLYDTLDPVFDPLSATDYPHLWHRGFPVQLLPGKKPAAYVGQGVITPLVQADLWNGDPDVDAVCRIALGPETDFKEPGVKFAGTKIAPFNSQNTFIHRDAFPAYFLFPHIGRMDDIWGAYALQRYHPNCVVFGLPSVYQERNPHDLSKDLEAEMLGYRHSLQVATGDSEWHRPIPESSLKAYEIYQECFA